MSRETFAQKSRPIDVLKDILGNYPFGVGIFRELIQNADDAGATTQVSQIICCIKVLVVSQKFTWTSQTFVLDHRVHSYDHLLYDELESTQGPALIAYNDALFHAQDWKALQNIFDSSKKRDPKYAESSPSPNIG